MKKLILITMILLVYSFQSYAKIGDKYLCKQKQSFMYDKEINEFFEIPRNKFEKSNPIVFWNKDTIFFEFTKNFRIIKQIIKQISNNEVDSFLAIQKYGKNNNAIETIRFENGHMVITTNSIGSKWFIGIDTYNCKKLN